MTDDPLNSVTLSHRLRRMTGRDTSEHGRASTPLELLFDLTFVAGFGQSAELAARLFAEGHTAAAIGGFAFAIFAVSWAWVNFSWFASAFDTDDWFYRVTTMVQMVGVLILTLGLPAFFTSLAEGHGIDNTVMVIGYVVMRVPMIAQWIRAGVQDPARRRVAVSYAVSITVAQLGWVMLLFIDSPLLLAPVAILVFIIDAFGPVVLEGKKGGTPWHAEHIAERYALLTIITLGEGIVGTVASVSAVVQSSGWSAEAILIVVAGTGLTFSLWWIYFILPSALILERYRRRAQMWAYLHILLFMAMTGVGAGLHAAAETIEHPGELGSVGVVCILAVAVLLFLVTLYGIYSYVLQEIDPSHGILLGIAVVFLLAAIGLAAADVPLGVCLVVLTLSPVSTVIAWETFGYRHSARALTRVLG